MAYDKSRDPFYTHNSAARRARLRMRNAGADLFGLFLLAVAVAPVVALVLYLFGIIT